MHIFDRTDTSFRLIKENVLLEDLKKTENGRYLWQYKNNIDDYKVNIRVSFQQSMRDSCAIETDHVRIERKDPFNITAILSIEDKDFSPSEELKTDRCTYIEKTKGMNVKCKFDKLHNN